jgi:hypothetical protein
MRDRHVREKRFRCLLLSRGISLVNHVHQVQKDETVNPASPNLQSPAFVISSCRPRRSHKGQQPNQPLGRRFRLGLEPLEDRRMLSVAVPVSSFLLAAKPATYGSAFAIYSTVAGYNASLNGTVTLYESVDGGAFSKIGSQSAPGTSSSFSTTFTLPTTAVRHAGHIYTYYETYTGDTIVGLNMTSL